MKADDIGRVEERFERTHALYADRDFGPGRNIGIETHNSEAEGLGAKRSGGANPTKADHAEGPPAQTAHERRQRAVEPADGIPNEMVMKADNAAGQREHQRDCVVGDLARAIVRRIAHRDAGSARHFQVDVIEADTRAHYNTAFWHFGYEVGVDPHLVPRHHAVRLRESIDGKAFDLPLPADCPVDIRSCGLPLDLAIVGILRIGREEMETQGLFSRLMTALRCDNRAQYPFSSSRLGNRE
jgi:hypothetical protein